MKKTLPMILYYALETFIVVISFFVAIEIRINISHSLLKDISRQTNVWLAPLAALIWFVLISIKRIDSKLPVLSKELLKLSQITLIGVVCLFAVSYLVDQKFVSRSFVFIFAVLSFSSLSLSRAIVCWVLRYYHKKGYDQTFVAIIGTDKHAISYAHKISKESSLQIVGLVSERETKTQFFNGHKILGNLEDISKILSNNIIDEIHLAIGMLSIEKVEKVLSTCVDHGVKTRIAISFLNGLSQNLSLEKVLDEPVLTISRSHHNETMLTLKRIFDIAVSCIAIIILSPIMIGFTLLVIITSTGSILFKQPRYGMNGRIFKMYKFRTMLDSINEQVSFDGPFIKKLEDNPRLTSGGRFLRRYSLDELPQLFNVLKGDMSIVGPRPLLLQEASNLEDRQRKRFRMRPGLTGLWQISGRSALSARKRIELDLEYIDQWSLLLDLYILLKTIPAVLSRKGAR